MTLQNTREKGCRAVVRSVFLQEPHGFGCHSDGYREIQKHSKNQQESCKNIFQFLVFPLQSDLLQESLESPTESASPLVELKDDAPSPRRSRMASMNRAPAGIHEPIGHAATRPLGLSKKAL